MSEAVKKELVGVKGWLLFFGILFTFIFPWVFIEGLFSPIYVLIERGMFYKIISASVAFFSLITGILIFLKRSKTKIFLQVFLIFYFLDVVINYTGYTDLKSLLMRIVQVAIVVSIVHSYFKNSERVKNTLVH